MSEGETTTDERQITLREGIWPWTGWLEDYGCGMGTLHTQKFRK